MIVQVRNYQIVSSADLEFLPGLNVIQGPSNNGKSSLFKALKSAFYTIPGTTPIKSGESAYMVGINYNGHKVVYKKGLKDSIYLVDGEKYTKFGTNTPTAVSEALNIKELELNGNKEQLNFWDQMDYPFLLDKTGGELFKFIVDSGDNDQVSKALKSMVSDRQQLSKDIDMLQGSINLVDLDISNLSNEIDSLKNKIDVSNKIISMKPTVAKFHSLKDSKLKLEDVRVKYTEVYLDNEIARYKLDKLNNIDSSIDLKVKDLDFYRSKADSLNNINVEKNNIDFKLNDVVKYKSVLNKDFEDLYNLKNNKVELDSISNKIKDVDLKISKIPKLKFDFNIEDLLDFKNIRMKIDELKDSYEECNDLISNYKEQINGLNELLNLFDVCPLCGGKLCL